MDKGGYLDIRSKVLRMLNSQEFKRHFGKGDNIKLAVDTMIKSLDIVAKGGRTGVGKNMMNNVVNGTKAVMEFVIYHRLSKFAVDFVLVYVGLVSLWNKELGYNFDLDIMVDAIKAIVSSYLTIMEANDVLRNLLSRAERYLKLEPPAYGVSRHFVDIVWKKLESGEKICDYPNEAIRSVNREGKDISKKQ